MKRFILNILYFFIPFLALAYFIDIFISVNVKKSNSYTKEYPVWNAIIDGKVNSDIVIYGSSRAWVQIDPAMITDSFGVPTYNLGIDGSNFWLQYLRHNLLLKFNRKPKLIIHSLDIFTLQKKKELSNPDQFLPYMLWNNEMKNSLIGYDGFTFFDFHIPLLRYYGKFDAVKTAVKLFIQPDANAAERIKGYQGQNLLWNSDLEKAKLAMKTYKTSIDTSSLILFEKYLHDCISDNINVVFVYTPEYIEGQKFTENRSEILCIFQQLSKKYKIPFYDFSNDSISFKKQYFYNALHLNKTGAELFTNKLIDTLKKCNGETLHWK